MDEVTVEMVRDDRESYVGHDAVIVTEKGSTYSGKFVSVSASGSQVTLVQRNAGGFSRITIGTDLSTEIIF